MRYIKNSQATSTKRQVYFDIRASDNSPATGEGGGQPQISTNGGAWTSVGISTLTHIGNGKYYATLTTTALGTTGDIILVRYKSASTQEITGDTIMVVDWEPETTIYSIDAKLGNWSKTTNNTVLGAFKALANSTAGLGCSDIASGGNYINLIHALPALFKYTTIRLVIEDYVVSATSTTLTGANWLSSIDNYYRGYEVIIKEGTGSGQSRKIISYDGTTRTVTVDRPWDTDPDGSSLYLIIQSTDANLTSEALTDINETLGDVYTADVNFIRDNANSKDEYTVVWYKNGSRVTGGVAGVTAINIIKRTDGTDLISPVAMTQIGSLIAYKYDASGAERLTIGESAIGVFILTIDGAPREYVRIIGRDS